MCSITSSASTIRADATRPSATSVRYSSRRLKKLRFVSTEPAAGHKLGPRLPVIGFQVLMVIDATTPVRRIVLRGIIPELRQRQRAGVACINARLSGIERQAQALRRLPAQANLPGFRFRGIAVPARIFLAETVMVGLLGAG